MDLNNILETVKKTYAPSKIVTLEGTDIEIELEILTSLEEAKVLEACKNYDDSNYLEAIKRYTLACSIKRIGDVSLRKDDIEYNDKDGKPLKKSKFLYMVDYIGELPIPIIDSLFEAYTDKILEITKNIKDKFKFEKFYITEKPAEEAPEKFQRLNDTVVSEELDENERLRLQVEKEALAETERMSAAEQTS